MLEKQLMLRIFLIVLILKQLSSGYCVGEFSDDSEEMKKKNTEVEEDILRLMGFLDQPKNLNEVPIRKRSAPEFLTKAYEYTRKSANKKEDSFSSERSKRGIGNFILTERDYRLIDESDVMISFVAQRSRSNLGKPNRIARMNFDVSSIAIDEIPTHGELRFYRGSNIHGKLRNRKFRLAAYQISQSSPGIKSRYFINAINVTANYEGWIILDITHTLSDWIRHGNDNHGIRITTEIYKYFRTEVKPESLGIVGFDGDPEKHTFMVAYYRHNINKPIQLNIQNITNKLRQKRSVTFPERLTEKLTSFDKEISSNPCTNVDYYVRFKDLHFNEWIIAPDGFSVGYCTGECTISVGSNVDNSNHAIIQTVLHSVYPKQIPLPCCVPIKLSPMSVLYFANHDQVVLKKYHDMVLDKCGCR